MARPIYAGTPLNLAAIERHADEIRIYDEWGNAIVSSRPCSGAWLIEGGGRRVLELRRERAEDLLGRWERFGMWPYPVRRQSGVGA